MIEGRLIALVLRALSHCRNNVVPGKDASDLVTAFFLVMVFFPVAFPCCLAAQPVVMCMYTWNPRLAMTDSVQQSDESSVTVRLKALLRDVCAYINTAPEDERQKLLNSLNDWWRGHRRKHSRKPCSMAVPCSTQDRVFIHNISNISASGVFIETPATFSVGQDITLTFSPTKGQEPVRVTGKIVRRIPKGIGVEFAMPDYRLETMIEPS